jgi:hypothetical protein
MRRQLLTLAVASVFGLALSAASAQACCHKGHRSCGTPAPCAAAPACEPCAAPVMACEPAPTCAPKKKCGLFGGGGGLCHKRRNACAPACEPAPTPCVGTVTYAAPVHYGYTYAAPQATYAAPQNAVAAPQAPGKGMPTAAPQAPAKGMPTAAPQAPAKG